MITAKQALAITEEVRNHNWLLDKALDTIQLNAKEGLGACNIQVSTLFNEVDVAVKKLRELGYDVTQETNNKGTFLHISWEHGA